MTVPVFLSLVGLNSENDELFETLQPMLHREFPDENIRFFGDIVEDWSKTRIAGRQKRSFTPGARFLFRWGLFYEKFTTEVEPAFVKDGVTLALARQFGYDVYTGALAHSDCDLTIQLHWPLVQEVIKDRGYPAPLYAFTTEITPLMRQCMKRYFASGTGQRYFPVPPEWPLPKKANYIIRKVHEEKATQRGRAA